MRYTGSRFRKSRRLGFSVLESNKEFEKGKKRRYAPGQHGKVNRKPSGYKEQLIEKQKIANLYGVTDKQLRRFFVLAKKMEGSNALNLLILLESRLDNIVYRLGMAATRRAARQLVSHGHITVNNKKNDIPSYIVKLNEVVAFKRSSEDTFGSKVTTKDTLPFVKFDPQTISGSLIRFPERSELNQEINETYVVE